MTEFRNGQKKRRTEKDEKSLGAKWDVAQWPNNQRRRSWWRCGEYEIA